MTETHIDKPLGQLSIPEALLEWVTAHAYGFDSGDNETAEALPRFAEAELVDLGAPFNNNGNLIAQAATLELLARHSFSAAFALWGHRMAIEFLELAHGHFANAALPKLRDGLTPGASAMAPGYKALAAEGDLNLRITRDAHGELRLSGQIGWASNLYRNAIAVAPAYGPDADPDIGGILGGVIVAFPLDSQGGHIGPPLELLAMRGTASTHVTLDNVKINEQQILSDDFEPFLQRSRPTLSILQASLCLGLATASYQQSIQNASGFNAVFEDEIHEQGQKLLTAKQQLADLATRVGTATPPAPQEILATRLSAGQLATQLTSLELKSSGGRGFVTTSDTNRRYREATFIPLQAPSEAQLRWELAQA